MASKKPITISPAEQEHVRRALKASGRSTRQIAVAAGCHHSYVAYCLRGEKTFQADTLERLYGSTIQRPTPEDLAAIEHDLASIEDQAVVEHRRLEDLKPHPANVAIYGDGADADLVESVREQGILTPLLVTRDGLVVSGHRRLDAAREAGLEVVPVTVLDREVDELGLEELLIQANKQRQKTPEQLAREYRRLKDIETERARARMAAGVGEGPRGKAADLAAEALGVGTQKAERAAKVVEKIDELRAEGKGEEAERLQDLLNNKSVHAAHIARMELEEAPPRPKGGKEAPVDIPQATRVPMPQPHQCRCEEGDEWDDYKELQEDHEEAIDHIAKLLQVNTDLKAENNRLRARISELEARVVELEGAQAPVIQEDVQEVEIGGYKLRCAE